MITLFNRKELLSTQDVQRQGDYTAVLKDQGIEYAVKTKIKRSAVPMGRGARIYSGPFAEMPSVTYTYIVYVKRKEFAKVCEAVSHVR